LQNAAKQLLQRLKEIENLDEQVKQAKVSTAAAVKEEEQRRVAVSKAVPPAPSEIHVTAEFPASRKDSPWIVDIQRNEKAPARQPWDFEPQSSLFWAPNHQAAGTRAQQIVADYKIYHVKGVRRFLDELAQK
jgi:DsbC/DsbD-like thiol-disulfide interchange protein